MFGLFEETVFQGLFGLGKTPQPDPFEGRLAQGQVGRVEIFEQETHLAVASPISRLANEKGRDSRVGQLPDQRNERREFLAGTDTIFEQLVQLQFVPHRETGIHLVVGEKGIGIVAVRQHVIEAGGLAQPHVPVVDNTGHHAVGQLNLQQPGCLDHPQFSLSWP